MKTIDFSFNGGLFIYQDTLEFMQNGYTQAFEAMNRGFGTKLILEGVQDVGGGNISNGWVIIDGVRMPFMGGPANVQVMVEDVTGDEGFDDGSTHTVYHTKRAKMVLTGDFDFTDLKPFRTDKLNVDASDVFASAKAVKQLHDRIMATIPFEDTIILKGCEVTNVVATTSVDISAGVVKMGDVIIESPAYLGPYPVWLKPDSTFVTAAPGAGLFVKFDPYSSQTYQAVKRRFDNATGAVIMFNVDIGSFPGGVGKWEWLGWKICDDLQSRVALGYDRRVSDPGDGIWDVNYNEVHNTGGLKDFIVTKNNIQEFPITSPGSGTTSGVGFPVNGNDSSDGTVTFKVGVVSPTPISKVQPYRVIKFLERI